MTHPERFRPRRPWVLTVYDVAWRTLGPDYLSVVSASWVRDAEAAIAAADHLLAISRATADELVRGGVPADRITVTPLGVDDRFRKVGPDQAQAVRDRYPLPGQFVLYVGAINVRKNVTALARAMAEPQPEHGVGLVLVGPPPKEGLATWGLDHPWVTHLGYVPDDDLPGLYAAASVIAIPAKLEGFGLPLVEALAAGTPVVASDLSVFREVGGDAPLYFPADDPAALRSALAAVLRDPAAAARMRSAGRDRAGQFTWSACAAATAEAYRQAVRGRGG
jgi:glycosyltransferase involved in cell wall biosynthesis